MSATTETLPDLIPGSSARPRKLAISELSLACCAVEAATGVSSWVDALDATDDVLNVLVVAGTVTRSNSHLVTQALATLAEPRAVVAFGVCTISGGPYWDSYAVLPGIAELVDVEVFVPGCPPHPSDLTRALRQLSNPADSALAGVLP